MTTPIAALAQYRDVPVPAHCQTPVGYWGDGYMSWLEMTKSERQPLDSGQPLVTASISDGSTISFFSSSITNTWAFWSGTDSQGEGWKWHIRRFQHAHLGSEIYGKQYPTLSALKADLRDLAAAAKLTVTFSDEPA